LIAYPARHPDDGHVALAAGPAGASGFKVEVMTTWWVEGAYIIYGCGPSGLDACEAGTYQFPRAVCDQATFPIQQVQKAPVKMNAVMDDFHHASTDYRACGAVGGQYCARRGILANSKIERHNVA